MIKRIYDNFNSQCYIKVKCDFCGFAICETDGYGLRSKDFFKELEKLGWKRSEDGKIACEFCYERVVK